MPLPHPIRVRRHNRPADHTDRLWSVRTQLLVPILVATVTLVVLGAVQTGTALDAATDAGRARVLAGTATATVRLVHELERELGETAALRQRGGTRGRPLVDAQRRRVDTAADRYRSAAREARRAAPALGRMLDIADSQLDRLGQAREAATRSGTADGTYLALVGSLLTVADALPAQLRDIGLANAAREVAAVAAQEHLSSRERDLLRTVFVRGELAPGELVRLGRLRGAHEQRQAEFTRLASRAARAAHDRLLAGSDVTTARRMRDAAAEGDTVADGDAWYVAQSGVIRRYNLLGRELSENLDLQAARLTREARWRALVTGGATTTVAATSLLTAALLAVRTSRRLRRLRAAALTMAHTELPARITAISAGEGVPNKGAGTRLAADVRQGRDEVAQVAEAFDTVHQAALRLAGEQAELRRDVTRMAEALARRIRTLITRQLRLLDEFEREETDPDALARLFALDHLAARMRRNGENLLVLAGGEPGRAQEADHLLADVVRAAVSEIEDYQRVEIDVPAVAVRGAAVGYLVHLLAELLENATTYSPPHTPVHVDGRRTVVGLTLRVHDQGIGISESRLAEINQRLLAPAVLSSAAAGSMGLHVVAHLAARHGIRVQLHNSRQGTVARVEIPEQALTRVEAVSRRPPPAPASPIAPVTNDRQPTASAAWFQPRSGPPTALAMVTATAHPAPSPPAGAATTGTGLPRRTRGGALPTALSDAPPVARADDPLDPEVVRARLSALAEGVSSAMRRDQHNGPIGRPQ
ncbi:sensor histidine kinase [Micromonospora sp. KC213]|uniref:sensor histidine kinase n=1 Tax=Micromonospora sp. KC213 TaxID=2530378 RepID=UPI00104D6D1B|nr:sensor histidine kinase [Micromonospora sp. KC213]TDC38713.1 sensor histidine kinase [Micromonospora sp. KC213]